MHRDETCKHDVGRQLFRALVISFFLKSQHTRQHRHLLLDVSRLALHPLILLPGLGLTGFFGLDRPRVPRK
jgi:hypothetical protein